MTRAGAGASNEKDLALAVSMAREAGGLLKRRFGEAQEVAFKGRINLVTEMDHESERLIVARIREARPDDDVLAEEGRGARGASERVWIVDPLDGTVNYAHEYPVWSVSIALQVAGRLEVGVVYNPLLEELYAGSRGGGMTLNGRPRRVSDCDTLERALLATGFSYDLSGDAERNNLGPFGRFILRAQAIRRAGSAALAIAKVAAGRTDGFWERGIQPWDMAAGALLVEEAGGRVSDYEGGVEWMSGKGLVATNGPLHDAMLAVLGDRPRADWGLPSADGDPPPRDEMMAYYVGYLFRGPDTGLSEEEGDRIQRQHLAYMRRQKEAGRYILTGPFADREDPRGMIVMRADSLDAARSVVEADPAVRAGTLRAELRPWYSAKGISVVQPGPDVPEEAAPSKGKP